jgi:MFS superfamily sulfate permease-like transporter
MTDVDVTAFGVLSELDEELERMGIELVFAELKDPVKERLARYGLLERIGRERFYPTIGVAVRRYLDEHPVGWTDWEDEPR